MSSPPPPPPPSYPGTDTQVRWYRHPAAIVGMTLLVVAAIAVPVGFVVMGGDVQSGATSAAASTSEATTTSLAEPTTTAATTTTTAATTTTAGATSTVTTTTAGATSTVTTTTATTTTQPPVPLNITGEPNYGTHSLNSGFPGDPGSWAIVAGGPVDLGALQVRGGAILSGWCATESPDLRLHWGGSGGYLGFRFHAGDGVSDTGMVVNLPDGTWEHSGDCCGGWDPNLELSSSPAGEYNIWLYTGCGDFVPGTLYISEHYVIIP